MNVSLVHGYFLLYSRQMLNLYYVISITVLMKNSAILIVVCYNI